MKSAHENFPIIMRVAVPYYGSVVRPETGPEKVYFLVDIDTERGVSKNCSMHIWNTTDQPELSRWLCRHGVQGVVCEDCRPSYERSLRDHGIWVRSGQAEVLEKLVNGSDKANAAA